ncbi:Putative serine/threonine-protein kinase, active [Septoria linicola]|uniref:non-specific serine/threonine protein kinase n=1 Tax=Septoria linicola TaxID=215465 RepID=A0A9Q9EK60_9PEZI|nr:putative serine/threonine-protein kinase, active [Septoria linicola]USW53730.1 Putative serine/threonine-protein kinase, active [Septoria linicola]
MVSDRAQWMWLESWGWVNAGINRKVKNAPKATIRKNWATLTGAQRTAIAQLIEDFRRDRDAPAVTRRALLPEPDNVDNSAANIAYQASLRNVYMAELQAALSTRLLWQQRQVHAPFAPRPTPTTDWLNNVATTFTNDAATTNTQLAAFQTAIDDWIAQWVAAHPGGTPPPSPGPEGAGFTIPPPPNATWIGAFPLGAGGQAIPAVYVRQNRHGHIIDRVVIKDTDWPYKYPDGATDPATAAESEGESLWDPDVSWLSADHTVKQPAEIGALNRLNPLALSQSIVRLRSWHRVYRNGLLRAYRTYMEFCGFGNLYQLSRKYTPYGDRKGTARPATVDEQDWLPEAFVWGCFEHLTRAGLVMASGAAAPWSQIIHNDLKPENIFLGTNTSNIYRGYPIVKIGDFGLATILSSTPARALPPDLYIGNGTPRTEAPEQLALRPDGTHNLAAHTNVWGIGLVIWSLLHSCAWGTQLYDDTDAHRNPRTAAFSPDHISRYSLQLRNLVLSCLELDPANRPSLNTLILTIRQATNPLSTTTVDLASGLRDAEASDPRFRGDLHSLKLSGEKWPSNALLARRWSSDAPLPAPAKGPPTDLTGPDGTILGPVAPGGAV